MAVILSSLNNGRVTDVNLATFKDWYESMARIRDVEEPSQMEVISKIIEVSMIGRDC